jgi:hypothetical protein
MIYAYKFFQNFHLSESSFTCSGLRASGLARRLQDADRLWVIHAIHEKHGTLLTRYEQPNVGQKHLLHN